MTNQKNKFSQLDIWWVNLEPAIGAEMQKNRPCVILQSNDANVNSRSFIVAPLLSGHKPWLFAVNVLPSESNAIDKPRYINLKQMRGVNISRVGRKLGILENSYLPAIQQALGIIFDI